MVALLLTAAASYAVETRITSAGYSVWIFCRNRLIPKHGRIYRKYSFNARHSLNQNGLAASWRAFWKAMLRRISIKV